MAAGVDAICLMTAATDSYVRHNIGMSQSTSRWPPSSRSRPRRAGAAGGSAPT